MNRPLLPRWIPRAAYYQAAIGVGLVIGTLIFSGLVALGVGVNSPEPTTLHLHTPTEDTP